jgi:uncharacterized membrane protein
MNEKKLIPNVQRFNPSSWPHRIPLIITGFIGLCIAMYLAFYQMHVVNKIWDPFFGDGTEKVLTSKFSQNFPIPDALLGAFGYLLDLILGSIGNIDRWRSQPRIVLLLGVIVGLMALTGILLILAQVFIIHTFCTLCLVSAIISFLIAAIARKEVLASIRFLQIEKQKAGSGKRFL